MNEKIIEKHITEILKEIGENLNREGLKETPKRVARAYKEWFRGYNKPDFKMKVFTSNYSGMLVRKQIPFQSFCEHHIAMYTGFIDFGYIPNGKVVGISKIVRFMQHYSARLTIQEDLTDTLIDKFCDIIKPKGAIIIIKANHSCEGTRGVKVPNVPTITSAIRGVFETNQKARDEFLSLIK